MPGLSPLSRGSSPVVDLLTIRGDVSEGASARPGGQLRYLAAARQTSSMSWDRAVISGSQSPSSAGLPLIHESPQFAKFVAAATPAVRVAPRLSDSGWAENGRLSASIPSDRRPNRHHGL